MIDDVEKKNMEQPYMVFVVAIQAVMELK